MFLLPLETNNPTRHRTDMLWLLIAANLVISFLPVLAPDAQQFFREHGFVPAHPTWRSALFSMFLHGSVWHILGNMFFLWMFGNNVEDVVGRFFFPIVFLLCGLGALALYYPFRADSTIPLIGASGAVSGIMGLYVVFFPKASATLVFILLRWPIGKIKVTMVVALLLWLAEQATLAMVVDLASWQRYLPTAFWAHVGGFLTGLALGFVFLKAGFMQRYVQKEPRHWLFGYVLSRSGRRAPVVPRPIVTSKSANAVSPKQAKVRRHKVKRPSSFS
jgi:membrane associated rhomboid family serine protease